MNLLQNTIAVVISGLGILCIVKGLNGMANLQERLNVDRNSESELTRAVGDILRVGRIAQFCTRVEEIPAPQVVWLECQIDRNVSPTTTGADDTVFRFGFANTKFQWLRREATNWVSHMSYDNVTGFELCDDARMKNGECTIAQTTITSRHIANLINAGAPTPANRFFRFQLTAIDDNTSRNLQGAFFVRHPTLAGGMYQWGLQYE